MAVPRIFFVPVLGHSSGSPSVSWRLVGGNNHDLGRSGRSYADLESAHGAVQALRAALSQARPVVSPGLRPGCWCWELHLDESPAAVSSRAYERQRDCVANLGYFMTALPVARIADELAALPVRREIRHPDYRIEPSDVGTDVGADLGEVPVDEGAGAPMAAT